MFPRDGKELTREDVERALAGVSARTVRAVKKNLDGRISLKRIRTSWYHHGLQK